MGGYQGLHDYLSHFNFSPCYASDEVEYIWHIIESQITAGMELFIPVNKLKFTQTNIPIRNQALCQTSKISYLQHH